MPSSSEKMRRLFAVAEHEPGKLFKKNRRLAQLPKSTLHEFASSVSKSRKHESL